MTATRILLLLFFVAVVGVLASCAQQVVKVPERVTVPVPVPCVKAEERPKRPALRTESDLMAMDRYRRTIAAWGDLKRWEAYGGELEAMVEACSRLPS